MAVFCFALFTIVIVECFVMCAMVKKLRKCSAIISKCRMRSENPPKINSMKKFELNPSAETLMECYYDIVISKRYIKKFLKVMYGKKFLIGESVYEITKIDEIYPYYWNVSLVKISVSKGNDKEEYDLARFFADICDNTIKEIKER